MPSNPRCRCAWQAPSPHSCYWGALPSSLAGGSGWTRMPTGVAVLCCLPEVLPVAEGCEAMGCVYIVEGKRRGWTWTHRPLPLTKVVVGSVLLDLRWDTWRCSPGTRGQPDSGKVHPFHGLSMGFTTKHKIFNNDVSDKAWLAQDGAILFGLFQFFEFSNCVPAWQSWSPNTFHLLIVPVKSRNNSEILIQSITVNISQDPNVYRELSKQLVGKE